MNVRCIKLAAWLGLAPGLCALPAISADPASKPPDVSQAGVSSILTNLNRTPPRKDGLKQLEDEFSKAWQSFSPKGSLDGIMAPQYDYTPPPPRVVIPNRHTKDELERRKNWMFGNPDDPSSTSQDPFKPSDSVRWGKEKSAFDELFEKLGGQRAAGRTKPSKDGSLSPTDRLPGTSDDSDLDDNAKLPSGIRESARTLRQKLLGTDPSEKLFSPGPSRNGLSELFAPSEENTLSKKDIQAHKDYIERFRQVLDYTPPVPDGSKNSLGSSLAGTATPLQPYGGFNSFRTPTPRDAVVASPGNINSIWNQATSPDLNANILNQWNPLYAPPTPDPPKPYQFSSPTMEVPRRRF
jgi:hypothetical protein